MAETSEPTTIEAVTWGENPNFEPHDPLGAEIRVTARNADGAIQDFLVDLSDGRYRHDMGSWIITPEERKRLSWNQPSFDIPTIVEAAEDFMDEQTAIIETDYITSDGDPIDVLITPEGVHVAAENRQYTDLETSSYQVPRFLESNKMFDTKSEAQTFVIQNFEQPANE